jgi:hypothetical protein
MGYWRIYEAGRGMAGDGSDRLTGPIEKPACLLAALVLTLCSICELSTPRAEPIATNEVVVWVNEAALDADWDRAFQAAAKAKPKQPVLKIPSNFDPDRS